MKRILVIGSLFAIIFATSCKKEESAPIMKGQDIIKKSQEWVKVKDNVSIGNVVADMYKNSVTGQEVFLEKYRNKTIPIVVTCDRNLYQEDPNIENSKLYCSGSGNECALVTIDGLKYMIICKK